MSARLFAAIDLPDGVRGRLADAAEGLRRAMDAAGMRRAFRWVAPANFHITIRFIGAVDDHDVEAVVRAMSRGVEVEAENVRVGRLATFPPSSRPRVLQVPVVEGTACLAALREEVDRRIGRWCTDETPGRPFAPHLTLARVRDRAPLDEAAFRAACDAAAWPEVQLRASDVTLYQSVTRPDGPEYSVLTRAALRSS